MIYRFRLLAFLLAPLWFFSLSAHALGILMARSSMNFDDTLEALKISIVEHGYAVAHVQRCDGGMRSMGYETDNYKTVFFGKYDEITTLSKKHPELIPYFPLKIAIIAEGKETILATLNPTVLGELLSNKALQIQSQRWHSDIISIMADMR